MMRAADPATPEPEEQEERKPSATQQMKNTKLSGRSTKRIPKELAEITLDLPVTAVLGLKEITLMNGDRLIFIHQVLYMKVVCFIWISHLHLIVHLSHQRLFSAPESITTTPTVRESSQKTTGVPL